MEVLEIIVIILGLLPDAVRFAWVDANPEFVADAVEHGCRVWEDASFSCN